MTHMPRDDDSVNQKADIFVDVTKSLQVCQQFPTIFS